MKTKLLFSLVVLACLGTTEARLFACTCAPPTSPCVAAERAQAVFVGQVLEIIDVKPGVGAPSEAPPGPFSRRVSFKVTETFRGAIAIGESPVVYTGSGGGDCGFGFDKGKSYLIYAHHAKTGQLTTTVCTRTRQATSGVAGEIKELRALAVEPKKCVQP